MPLFPPPLMAPMVTVLFPIHVRSTPLKLNKEADLKMAQDKSN
jgi:hypothetical protein